MIPSREVWQKMQSLLAADPTTLAPVGTPNKVHLIVAPFTPSLTLDHAALPKASFPGSAPIPCTAGAQETYVDVESGYSVIELKEPAGGWHWEASGPVVTAETIYGYIVTDDAGAVLIGSGLLDAPVTIESLAQGLSLDKIQLRFATTSPF